MTIMPSILRAKHLPRDFLQKHIMIIKIYGKIDGNQYRYLHDLSF